MWTSRVLTAILVPRCFNVRLTNSRFCDTVSRLIPVNSSYWTLAWESGAGLLIEILKTPHHIAENWDYHRWSLRLLYLQVSSIDMTCIFVRKIHHVTNWSWCPRRRKLSLDSHARARSVHVDGRSSSAARAGTIARLPCATMMHKLRVIYGKWPFSSKLIFLKVPCM
jgi:hypothetical protein